MPTVYRYFRFSDDILVFSTSNDGIADQIKSLLPSPMQFNAKSKNKEIRSLKHTNSKPCVEPDTEFIYLGYKFEIENFSENRHNRKFRVRISEQKITLRKTRLFLSMKAFMKDGNAKNLIDRIQYLSSNFEVTQNGHTHGSSKRKIKAGIYYNYKFCGEYSSSKRGPVRMPHDGNELQKLDALYQNLISSKKSQFSTKIKSDLSVSQYKKLTGLCS